MGHRLPKPPKHLGPVGQRLWKRVVSGLKGKHDISRLHVDALADFCDLVDEIDSLKRYVRIHGEVYDGPNGAMCEKPQSKMLDRKRVLLRKYMSEFGLTPSADVKLNGKQEEKDDSDSLDFLGSLGATRN